ncbi:hypothetical protein V866_002886 [Kwoniella sp. B9012]
MSLPAAAPSLIPLAPISNPCPLVSNTTPNNQADPSPSSKSSSRSITPPIPGAFIREPVPVPVSTTLVSPQRPSSQRSSRSSRTSHTPSPPLISSQPMPILPMDSKQPISSQDLFGTKTKEKKQGWCSLKWERCKDRCSECCSNCQCEVSFGVGMDF